MEEIRGLWAIALVTSLIAHRHIRDYLAACGMAIAGCVAVLLAYGLFETARSGLLWNERVWSQLIMVGVLSAVMVAVIISPVVFLAGLPFLLVRRRRRGGATGIEWTADRLEGEGDIDA